MCRRVSSVAETETFFLCSSLVPPPLSVSRSEGRRVRGKRCAAAAHRGIEEEEALAIAMASPGPAGNLQKSAAILSAPIIRHQTLDNPHSPVVKIELES